MNRIFFVNPFPGLRPSYGFPAVNRFEFFCFSLLACSAVVTGPSASWQLSFHYPVCCSHSPLDPGLSKW